jgi:hypothetical protein
VNDLGNELAVEGEHDDLSPDAAAGLNPHGAPGAMSGEFLRQGLGPFAVGADQLDVVPACHAARADAASHRTGCR